jgi:hypothetical protein
MLQYKIVVQCLMTVQSTVHVSFWNTPYNVIRSITASFSQPLIHILSQTDLFHFPINDLRLRFRGFRLTQHCFNSYLLFTWSSTCNRMQTPKIKYRCPQTSYNRPFCTLRRMRAACDGNVASGHSRNRPADEGILLQKEGRRKQSTQQQLSFPSFHTSLWCRVRPRNTKLHRASPSLLPAKFQLFLYYPAAIRQAFLLVPARLS